MCSFYIKTTINEIKKKKINYALGVAAVFVVVVSVGLLISIISRSPIMMLRISEIDHGEQDLVLRPSYTSRMDFLNYTMISQVLKDTDQPDALATPRLTRWVEGHPLVGCATYYTLPNYTTQYV